MTRNLRDYGSNFGLQTEHLVVDEISPHASEIDRTEEVLQIKVKDEAPAAMHFGIRNDGTAGMETVRGEPKFGIGLLTLLNASIEQFGQTALQQCELRLGCMN